MKQEYEIHNQELHTIAEQQRRIRRVLVCDMLPEDALIPLREKGYHVDFQPKISADELQERVGDYHALLVRSRTRITEDVLQRGSNLQIVVRAGVGFDNINVASATERDIVVANTPEGNTNAAAEMAIGLLFAVARNIPQADREIREGRWTPIRHVGMELKGKTLGVIGFGHIGQEVVAKAHGLGMKTLAYDVYPSQRRADELEVELVSFDSLLESVDVASVHVPLLPSTYHLLSYDQLTHMRSNAVIINTARGGVVHEDAVVDALDAGRLGGAGFDVFEHEPEINPRLLAHPKVIVTPHLGASTHEAQQRVAREATAQIIAAFEGKPIPGAINKHK